MDKSTKDWYEAQFEMFNCEGYKQLREQLQTMHETFSGIKGIEDMRTLGFRQGQLDILEWLMNWEASVNTNFKEAEDDKSPVL